MRRADLLSLLEEVAGGRTGPAAALERLKDLPFEMVGEFATMDTHRSLRCGFPEVVLAQWKTPEQCARISAALAEKGEPFLVTRADPERGAAVTGAVPKAVYHDLARVVQYLPDPAPEPIETTGPVGVVTAGTADQPVAEEAALTLETMGIEAVRVFDVGIAGLHRLLARRQDLEGMAAVIVAAGMEGALPSVVGGLLAAPVIAVPTSVGYGASAGGWAALLGMLSSCASGVVVVNIDNGFGAAYAAARIVTVRDTDTGSGEPA